jgi:aryl-alcohol dehydrogenase-like predicted oxidoreductase
VRTTTLGSTGPPVGVIGLGCMGMSYAYDMAATRDDDTAIAVIRQAIDLGATLIDTADAYGPYTNEELVGRALAGGYRERAMLATKVGVVTPAESPHRAGQLPVDGSPEHVRASIDRSLRRLGVDHVDLYQLHRVDPEVPLDDTWGAMAELVSAGKVRAIGLSQVSVEQIRQAEAIHPVASVQSEMSLWARDYLTDVLPYCEQHGIAFLPFSPLGNGFLTGRFTSVDELPDQDARRSRPRFQREALQANLAIVDAVKAVAARLGVSPAQVALAWLLAQGRYVVPIPGTKTPKYLADNIGAADVVIGGADLAELNALPAPVGALR